MIFVTHEQRNDLKCFIYILYFIKIYRINNPWLYHSNKVIKLIYPLKVFF